MNRLTKQQVQNILFRAQIASYPNEEVPEILKPLYTYVEAVEEELDRHKKWVNDLQSGMYINCVYCGHRYGPADKVPASMADVLKEHIEKCPEHPMSKLRAELEQVKAERDAAIEAIKCISVCDNCKRVCQGEDECLDNGYMYFEWRGLEGRA